jgi:HAD superfamily hydrolase (TIGR01509 family)
LQRVQSKQNFKAVLFDHDGTLVDSEIVHFALWQKVLAAHGATLSIEFYADHCAGVPTKATAPFLIDHYQIHLTPEMLINEKRLAEVTRLSTTPYALMPFASDFIRLLASHNKIMAVVTGAPAPAAQRSIDAHALGSYLPRVFSGQDTLRNKPSPDCYLEALNQLGLKASDCIAFEDTEHGLLAATDAGIKCYAVPHELSKGQNFSRASAVFKDFSEAAKALL